MISPDDVPGFESGTPLWYYILYESEATRGGLRLGPTGGGIVADVFLGLLKADKAGLLHGANKKVDLGADTGSPFADMLVFAGVATRP